MQLPSQDTRFARLPKWAQDGITQLERLQRETEARLRAERDVSQMDGSKTGRCAIRQYGTSGMDDQVLLPDDTKIRFGFPPVPHLAGDKGHFDIEVGIQRAHRGQLSGCWLQIRGMNSLEVAHDSSNTFYVRVSDGHASERANAPA